MITKIPVEHAFAIGAKIRARHGTRVATITGIDFTYDLVYLLRYDDNGQESTQPIFFADHNFDAVGA
jgi:hypothetical protein